MLDNDLFKLFLPIIQNGLIANGLTTVGLKQANQPTQQGVNTGPMVFVYKVAGKRYGFLQRKDDVDLINQVFTHTEMQYYETTFQVSTLVTQSPTDTFGLTASDLADLVASFMQSDVCRATLLASEVGILRVLEVRNPYSINDKSQFQANPSFDFTLIHKQVTVSTTPIIESINYGIYRV